MRILYIDSQQQPCVSIAFALARLEYDVARYPKEIEDITIDEEEQHALESFIKDNHVALVIGLIFSVAVAKITHCLGIRYAIWCKDSPAYLTWCKEAAYDNCAVFYFDHWEYELRKQAGYNNVYYLPLAADVAWSERLVITDEDVNKYSCDVSFIGGLYSSNVYDKVIDKFTGEEQQMFTDVIEQSAFVWDRQDCIHMPPELIAAVIKKAPEVFMDIYDMSVGYYLNAYMLGRKLSHVERTLILQMLAQQYDFHLYTWNTEKVPEGIRRFPQVDLSDEGLKIHHISRINLNITLRSIVSGIPERVYDVMSVGGFMLSNWQPEIPELFEENKEIVTYRTPEELVDKVDYYLRHESERQRIAVNGYLKVKRCYTYDHQLRKMLDILHM